MGYRPGKIMQHSTSQLRALAGASKERQTRDSLQQLQASLPPQVEVWAGGRSPVLYKRPPDFLHILDLHQVEQTIADWRRRHQGELRPAH